MRASLADVDVAAEAATCGVEADTLRAAASAFAQAGAAAIIYGKGVAEGPGATATISALVDLALLTGNIGRPGTGLYPLRSGANSQGLADMGMRPARLPGDVAVVDTDARGRLEAAWGVSLPFADGLSVGEMVSAVERGELALCTLWRPTRPRLQGRRGCRNALDKRDSSSFRTPS